MLRLRGGLSELPKVVAVVDGFAAAHALAASAANAMNLVLDEILSNIIKHGSTGGKMPEIRLALSLAGGQFCAEVEDDGLAFNPLNAPPADLGGGLSDRHLGGVGLHFVRHLANAIEYQRLEGRNCLAFRVDPAATQP